MAFEDIRPGSTISVKTDDKVLFRKNDPDDEALEEDLTQKMIRRPTEADFEEVLTPEGNSGDIVGSDIADSTVASNASVGGTR